MLAAEAVALDEDPHAEAREVDDHGKDGNCCNEVHDDGRVLTPEGLTDSAALVVLGEEVEKGNVIHKCVHVPLAPVIVDGMGIRREVDAPRASGCRGGRVWDDAHLPP